MLSTECALGIAPKPMPVDLFLLDIPWCCDARYVVFTIFTSFSPDNCKFKKGQMNNYELTQILKNFIPMVDPAHYVPSLLDPIDCAIHRPQEKLDFAVEKSDHCKWRTHVRQELCLRAEKILWHSNSPSEIHLKHKHTFKTILPVSQTTCVLTIAYQPDTFARFQWISTQRT